MRRLSIIDVEGGHQPISNETGKIWVVLNGEIYNFRRLRDELIELGHVFRTKTDTEVIVHLYEEYGTGCLEYLAGMFAFAIWDERDRTLFIARDRAGKKPLVYCQYPGGVSFASEIGALLKDGEVGSTPDIESLDLYLAYQFIPHPWTIYQEIKKLPPAHYMVVRDGQLSIQRYWHLDFTSKLDISEDEAKNELLSLFEDAVRSRLISDVPLGTLLSGGLDSSAVVAMMTRFSSAPVKTFSIGFEDEKMNELPYAREVARLFKTDHHELVVRPDIEGLIDRLPSMYGEPFADKSAVPTYYVSEMARRDVTVALNGDGGDEAFAGYKKYDMPNLGRLIESAPASLRKTVDAALGHVCSGRGLGRPMSKLRQKLLPHTASLYYSEYFDGYRKASLYNDRMKSRLKENRIRRLVESFESSCAGIGDPVDRMLYIDFNHYLPGDLLVKADIASMANSLELRSPFLDHRLIEFCASLPSSFKVKAGRRKHIFKKAMEGVLPAGIIDRPKKGFAIPVENWLRNELKARAENNIVKSGIVNEYFSMDYVRGIIGEHFSGRRNHAQRIWALMVLGQWDMTRPG